MNEKQQQAIDNLSKKNELFIIELNEIYSNMQERYKEYKEFEDKFYLKINKMEKAHSHIFFKPYSDSYCIRDGEFSIPSRACIIDDLYGEINEEFKLITPEGCERIYTEYSVEFDDLRKEIEIFNVKLNELMGRIISSNSITKRLSGIQDKIEEIEQLNKTRWYPKELAKEEYTPKGQLQVPASILGSYIQISLPIHRVLLIEYDYLPKTKVIQLNLVNKIRDILMYINEFLPFAELAPLTINNGNDNIIIHNNNDNRDNRTEIGNNTKIGSNNAIGENANLEGTLNGN